MKIKLFTTVSLGLGFFFLLSFVPSWRTEVPRVFTAEYLDGLLLPLADSTVDITHVPDSQYYKLKETVIYKTFPLYLPGREPTGYYDSLRTLEPVVAFAPEELVTEADWIAAGELVYDWALGVRTLDSSDLEELRRDHDLFNLPVTAAGIVPFFKLTVREKGKVEVLGRTCNTCHTKVMPDGTLLKGGQGNYPFDQNFGADLQARIDSPTLPDSLKDQMVRGSGIGLYEAYWMQSPAQQRLTTIDAATFIATLKRTYGGVMHRHGTVLGSPTSIPDLYNLEDRRYLDHTGLMRHRGIEDLMLYATLNETADRMDKYAGRQVMAPWPSEDERMYQFFSRYSDAQLYALAKFIYSLEPPVNPETYPNAMLERGKRVFIEQGCVTCHAPPNYTINQLTPVDGFDVPRAHIEAYDIFDISIETDPTLALESRRGTGYYKIPSLIGVWNRQALLHDGSIRSLEELLDPARLEDDYVPKGFYPAWEDTHPVKGHPFGLDIPEEDKEALIAFLRKL